MRGYPQADLEGELAAGFLFEKGKAILPKNNQRVNEGYSSHRMVPKWHSLQETLMDVSDCSRSILNRESWCGLAQRGIPRFKMMHCCSIGAN